MWHLRMPPRLTPQGQSPMLDLIMWAGRSITAVLGVVLFTSIAHAADPPRQADPAKTAEAKKAFAAGVNLLQDPDGAKYEDALLQFRRAYDLIGTWKVLGNIGICAMKLERDGEAIEAFTKYLKEGGTQIDAEERAQVERDIATLKASVVTLHLGFPAAGGKLIDERVNNRGVKTINEYAIGSATLDLGIHAGRHTLVARLSSGESRWDSDFVPGSKAEHSFAVDAAKTPEVTPAAMSTVTPTTAPTSGAIDTNVSMTTSRPIPLTVWVSGGATAAMLIGATVTGLMATSKRSSFNEINGQPGRQEEAQSLHDSAVTLGTVNTVFTGATIVGAGLTAYFFFTRPQKSATSSGKPIVSPWMTADGAGILFRSEL
jgi:hypothetical protein